MRQEDGRKNGADVSVSRPGCGYRLVLSFRGYFECNARERVPFRRRFRPNAQYLRVKRRVTAGGEKWGASADRNKPRRKAKIDDY